METGDITNRSVLISVINSPTDTSMSRAVLHRLVLLLRSLITSIDENTRAIRQHDNSKDNRAGPPPEIVVKPIMSLPPAIQAYYETEQHERPIRNKRERIKRTFEYCGVALLALYTAYTIKMYYANKEAADAAKSAAITATRQLEMSERPWIAVQSIKVTSLSLSHDGVNIGLTMKAKNFGHSPGEQSQFSFDLISPRLLNATADSICERITTASVPGFDHFGKLVIPTEEWEVNTGATLRSQDFASISLPNGKLAMSFRLLGCIAYKSELSSRWFTTKLSYDVHTNRVQYIMLSPPTDRFDLSVPLEAISIYESMNGTYTDNKDDKKQ